MHGSSLRGEITTTFAFIFAATIFAYFVGNSGEIITVFMLFSFAVFIILARYEKLGLFPSFCRLSLLDENLLQNNKMKDGK